MTFNTWELLLDMEVSRTVDEEIIDGRASDEIKKMIRSFLPRFPDAVRLDGDIMKFHHHNEIPPPEKISHGEHFWLLATNKDNVCDCLPLFDPSHLGDLAKLLLGVKEIHRPTDTGDAHDADDKTAYTAIRQEIPIERFFEYFKHSGNRPTYDERNRPFFDETPEASWIEYLSDFISFARDGVGSVRVTQESGIIEIRVVIAGEDDYGGVDDYCGMEMLCKQLDGTWAHVYSFGEWWYSKCDPVVGLNSIFTQREMELILESLRDDHGIDTTGICLRD